MRGAFAFGLCRCRRLSAELPAGVDEVVERCVGLEHPDQLKLLDPEAQARLNLGHPHVRRGLGLVVDGDALARAASGNEYLHAEVAEGGVAGGGLDRLLRRRRDLVDRIERILRGLAHFRLLLRLVGAERDAGRCQRQCQCHDHRATIHTASLLVGHIGCTSRDRGPNLRLLRSPTILATSPATAACRWRLAARLCSGTILYRAVRRALMTQAPRSRTRSLLSPRTHVGRLAAELPLVPA